MQFTTHKSQSLLVISSLPISELLPALKPHAFIDPSLSSPDTLIIEPDKSISIDQVRQIKHFIQSTPIHQSHKLVLIFHLHLASAVAQNALLKILEEPPSYGQIIATSVNQNQILPTIISRTNVLTLTNPTKPISTPASTPELPNISTHTIGERLNLSDTYSKNKATALQFIVQAIHHTRVQLKINPTATTLYNLTLALYTHKLIHQNINAKLALDQFLIKYK